jgi:hypothetical protein
MSTKDPILHKVMMLGAVILPFWFKVNPWPGQTEVDFFIFVIGCGVVFFFGYMRWFAGAWRPVLVMFVALAIRIAIIPAFVFVIWFLFLRTEGCWELMCYEPPEDPRVIMERFCKEKPEDSRCR